MWVRGEGLLQWCRAQSRPQSCLELATSISCANDKARHNNALSTTRETGPAFNWLSPYQSTCAASSCHGICHLASTGTSPSHIFFTRRRRHCYRHHRHSRTRCQFVHSLSLSLSPFLSLVSFCLSLMSGGSPSSPARSMIFFIHTFAHVSSAITSLVNLKHDVGRK